MVRLKAKITAGKERIRMDSKNNTFEKRCHKAHCRSCNQAGLTGVLDLGMMPLSDGLLTEEQLTGSEEKFPL